MKLTELSAMFDDVHMLRGQVIAAGRNGKLSGRCDVTKAAEDLVLAKLRRADEAHYGALWNTNNTHTQQSHYDHLDAHHSYRFLKCVARELKALARKIQKGTEAALNEADEEEGDEIEEEQDE